MTLHKYVQLINRSHFAYKTKKKVRKTKVQ